MSLVQVVKHYCIECNGTKNHKVLAQKNIREYPDDQYDPEDIETKYFMVECMGCENISFRTEVHEYHLSYYDEDTETEDYAMTIKGYPYYLENYKPLPGKYSLPRQIRIVYDESVEAFKGNCLLLAGVGFRAVIESVCIDKKVSGGNIEKKINNLAKNRYITEKEEQRLHAIRFMGNDSIHEMNVPKRESLYVVLDIIENLLKNLYIIDDHAKRKLDTIITDFEDFATLLMTKLKKFKVGDDLPLTKYLEKDVRRLNRQVAIFESELIKAIGSGDFNKLSIGDIKQYGTDPKKVQHFVLVK